MVLDKLTYAGRTENLEGVAGNPCYVFVEADIAHQTAALRQRPQGSAPLRADGEAASI